MKMKKILAAAMAAALLTGTLAMGAAGGIVAPDDLLAGGRAH